MVINVTIRNAKVYQRMQVQTVFILTEESVRESYVLHLMNILLGSYVCSKD